MFRVCVPFSRFGSGWFSLCCLGLLGTLPIWGADSSLIDGYLAARYKKAPTLSGKHLIEDRLFARRAYLDLAGRLPTVAETQQFFEDNASVRRARLVERLLASEAFTERLSALIDGLFYNQMLTEEAPYRNAFRRTIRDLVAQNHGWDEIATLLITDAGEVDEPIAGNFAYTLEFFEEDFYLDAIDDTLGNLSEAFLGVKIDCISCHDGAGHLERVNKGLSVMKRTQFWGMAAFISGIQQYVPANQQARRVRGLVDLNSGPFRDELGVLLAAPRFMTGDYLADSMVGEGMRPPRFGGAIQPRYLFTGEEPKPGEDRRAALARMITADRQFARNMVNRVWFHLFGSGFVEPLNQWDLGLLTPESAANFDSEVQARDARLMEELASYFIASDFDLRALYRLICTSGLYQLDYSHLPEAVQAGDLPPWLTRARIRRMEAEALLDSIFVATQQERFYMISGVYDRTFQSAWALIDENEPNSDLVFGGEGVFRFDPRQFGYRHLGDFLEKQRTSHELLERLGRPDRSQRSERDPIGNIQGVLSMFNSEAVFETLLGRGEPVPVVATWTQALEQGHSTVPQVTREVFLHLLFREPLAHELNASQAYFEGRDPDKAIADLFWALMNHPDFSYK